MKKKYKIVKNKGRRTVAAILLVATFISLLSVMTSVVSNWITKQTAEEPEVSTSKNGVQALMQRDGYWVQMEEYGMEFWMPADAGKDDRDYGSNCVTYVQRDKGLFPELSYGIIVFPDEPGSYNLVEDPMGLVNELRPLFLDVLETVWNGVNGSVALDISLEETAANRQILSATGKTYCTVVYKDSKPGAEESEPWSNEEEQTLYCNFAVVNGRPVMSWSTYDLIVYKGEEIAKEISSDIICSVREID